MNESFRAAAVQMHSGDDKNANLETAARLVARAADEGAKLVVLPEYVNYISTLPAMAENAEPIPGPSSETLRELAQRHGIYLQAGSICEKASEPNRAYNSSLLFSPDGTVLAKYRKLHLFDVDIPGQISNQESRWIVPGDAVVATATPLACVGHATCYDLRFSNLFGELAERETQVLAFPSAFSAPTGRAHWEILLRARAIEHQIYVVAANQCGRHTSSFSSYGHSMIVDPWGEILARATDEPEAVVVADVDLERLAAIRRNLPCRQHRLQLRRKETNPPTN